MVAVFILRINDIGEVLDVNSGREGDSLGRSVRSIHCRARRKVRQCVKQAGPVEGRDTPQHKYTKALSSLRK